MVVDEEEKEIQEMKKGEQAKEAYTPGFYCFGIEDRFFGFKILFNSVCQYVTMSVCQSILDLLNIPSIVSSLVLFVNR